MSRLDSAIRRLTAQKLALEWAARAIAGRPGPVLELGLGNGRTYDHIRALLPDRDIFVFDRQIAAHPDCIPDDEHLFLGDIRETLPRALARLDPTVVLAHLDVGNGHKSESIALAALMVPLLAPLLVQGAVVVSDQQMPMPGAVPLPVPDGIQDGRIWLQRIGGA